MMNGESRQEEVRTGPENLMTTSQGTFKSHDTHMHRSESQGWEVTKYIYSSNKHFEFFFYFSPF